jgi:hypothetical protein
LNLDELNSLVQRLIATQEKLREKQNDYEKTKAAAAQESRETERLKKLALVSGKSFDASAASEKAPVEKVESEISELRNNEAELEKQIAKGISELKLPIKDPNPRISEGNAIFDFEGKTYDDAIDYLKATLSMKQQQLVIDNVVFHGDKVTVVGKSDAAEATDCLMNAAKSIWALGSIMLGKTSEEMIKAIDSLRASTHRQLWEFLGERGAVSLETAYESFGLTDDAGKKRARTFYSQLESRSKPPLAIGDGRGNFQLTIYGRLVWASYKKTGGVSEPTEKPRVRSPEAQETEKGQPTEATRKPSQTALQNFMEKVLLKEGE